MKTLQGVAFGEGGLPLNVSNMYLGLYLLSLIIPEK